MLDYIYVVIWKVFFLKETMSNETIIKYLNGTTNDIELDLLLAKTTTLSSSLTLINQLVNNFS